MDDLYRELIIDRYKNPQFKGMVDPHQVAFEDENPLCGDFIRVELQVDNQEVIIKAGFDGHGCAISQASADLLMESLIGMKLIEVKDLTKDFVLELLGIELGPVRLKCALLPLKVVKAGVYGLGEATDELVG